MGFWKLGGHVPLSQWKLRPWTAPYQHPLFHQNNKVHVFYRQWMWTHRHDSHTLAFFRALSRRVVLTRCIMRNCPFIWKTGMSYLYLSIQMLFSGRLMSTSCNSNWNQTNKHWWKRNKQTNFRYDSLTLCIYGSSISFASSHRGHGCWKHTDRHVSTQQQIKRKRTNR